MSLPRMRKELKALQESKEGYTAAIVDDDAKSWKVTIKGPDNTPYKGGTFALSFKFPDNFPFSPPKVLMTTKIYHVNVSEKGELCVPELTDKWAPALTMAFILGEIVKQMVEPKQTALNEEAAKVLASNKKQYEETAAAWTAKYAV